MVSGIKSYKDLVVWQRSFALANEMYAVTVDFPQQQRFGLAVQMQRAAVSVVSNIAEGFNRKSTKEYTHFLVIALGSLAELETQVLIAATQGFVIKDKSEKLLQETDEIGKMLRVMTQRLRQKQSA